MYVLHILHEQKPHFQFFIIIFLNLFNVANILSLSSIRVQISGPL